MSPPIRDGSGSSIGSIRLGDGSEISEVRTGAGDVLFSAGVPSSGLVHQFDATQISGSDGDSLGTWTNQVGTVDLAQSDNSRQPTLKTNVINGKQVVRIQNQSNNHYLDTGAISAISSGWTVYVVGQFSSTGSGTTNATGGLEDGGGNPFFGENNQQWAFNSGGSEINGSSEDTNPHIWGFKLTSTADGTLRLDGSEDATGGLADDDIDAITLGARGSDDFGADWDAGEVLVYNKHLSTSEDADVESHLSDKWDITV